MEGIKNFLLAVNNNWTTIVVIIGLGIGVYQKVKSYLRLTDEQKARVALEALDEVILSMVSDAEKDYAGWKKAGELKRSQVVSRIFKEFPILTKVMDATQLYEIIDDCIDAALENVESIVNRNNTLSEKE